MKPGQRRLLIPGLLIALMLIVVIAAAARRVSADTPLVPIVAHTQVSTISDSRITESSGLAASRAHPGLVYTINDSGDEARVFAVDIASGRVVGETSVVDATWHDAEAMALFGGKLWVADIGSNRGSDEGRALYVLDEPGPGNHRTSADRYPVDFAGGKKLDAESIVVLPGRVYIVSKAWPQGNVFQLTGALEKDRDNVAQLTRRVGPLWATDATSTPDGKFVLLRGPVQVEVRDARTWTLRHAEVIPALQQGESITVEASGTSYLIGSEGRNSPLVRVAFNPATFTTPPPEIDVHAQARDQARDQAPLKGFLWSHRSELLVVGPLAAGSGLLVVLLIVRRRRNRLRARRTT